MKFKKIVKESADEMTPEEYAEAGQICRSLLREIGADDSQNNIFDIIEKAATIDPNGLEVNGDSFERIENGKVVVYDYSQPNHERYIAINDIDWIRVEGYGDKSEYNGAYIMYIYLHLNKSRSIIDQNNIQFDYYPDPNSDDYVDSVEYSTCKQYMTNGMVNEAEEGGYASDHPRIYVGTYAKYNDGSIDGKWIDLTKYSTYEEFLEACYRLHEDEDDPEFMVQDYENFPERWYHEGGLPTEEEFDKINDYYLMDDSEKPAYEEYVDLGNGDDPDSFRDAYIGEFSDPEEFGEYAVDNWGMPQDKDSYFDYDSFGRDLTMDWHQGDDSEMDAEGEPEDPDYYYDSDGYQQEAYGSDSEVGESYVDNIGGVEQLGKDTIDTYFDYEAFGRDLLISDCTESNGYVFWNR